MSEPRCDLSGLLFDDPALYVPPPISTDPALSAGRRQTLRQREGITVGKHPLTGGPLHPYAAPETCTPDSPARQPFTCGSCRFRQLLRWHDRVYPKCVEEISRTSQDGAEMAARTLDSATWISHGAATDVRAWWPACHRYESGDTTLSPDASRVIPP